MRDGADDCWLRNGSEPSVLHAERLPNQDSWEKRGQSLPRVQFNQLAIMMIVAPPSLCRPGSLAYSPSSEKVCLALSKLQSMCDIVSHSGITHSPEQADGLRGRAE